MATTDAQKRATAKYQREKMKSLTLRFSPAELALFEHAKAQPNTSGYIKGLIRKEMEK